MTPWQRELERRTWANKHCKNSRRAIYLCRIDDGGRQDLGVFSLPHVGYMFAMADRIANKRKFLTS